MARRQPERREDDAPRERRRPPVTAAGEETADDLVAADDDAKRGEHTAGSKPRAAREAAGGGVPKTSAATVDFRTYQAEPGAQLRGRAQRRLTRCGQTRAPRPPAAAGKRRAAGLKMPAPTSAA